MHFHHVSRSLVAILLVAKGLVVAQDDSIPPGDGPAPILTSQSNDSAAIQSLITSSLPAGDGPAPTLDPQSSTSTSTSTLHSTSTQTLTSVFSGTDAPSSRVIPLSEAPIVNISTSTLQSTTFKTLTSTLTPPSSASDNGQFLTPSLGPSSATVSGPAQCSKNGELLCNGPGQFGLCDWGTVVWQDVALGTACQAGKIVFAPGYGTNQQGSAVLPSSSNPAA
ncbi:MAG: hypothetical protein M1820_003651 [Bogoriella megaspora]|nr:MAG: hypothetical protein M1820_003651 [Bogoriella megaspora]